MKRLITEADLRRLDRGARVVVERGTLVTPAARDYALVMGVELVDASPWPARPVAAPAGTGGAAACCGSCAQGGPCAGCGANGGGGASVTLGDGDWLVQVRGGKASARRVVP